MAQYKGLSGNFESSFFVRQNRIDVQSFIGSNRCKNKKARDEEHISQANRKDLDQARGSAFRFVRLANL